MPRLLQRRFHSRPFGKGIGTRRASLTASWNNRNLYSNLCCFCCCCCHWLKITRVELQRRAHKSSESTAIFISRRLRICPPVQPLSLSPCYSRRRRRRRRGKENKEKKAFHDEGRKATATASPRPPREKKHCWLVGRRGAAARADFERISKFFLLSDQWRIEGGRLWPHWQRLMMDRMKKTPPALLSLLCARRWKIALDSFLVYSTFSSSLLSPRRAVLLLLMHLVSKGRNDWTSRSGQSSESVDFVSVQNRNHSSSKNEPSLSLPLFLMLFPLVRRFSTHAHILIYTQPNTLWIADPAQIDGRQFSDLKKERQHVAHGRKRGDQHRYKNCVCIYYEKKKKEERERERGFMTT